MTMSSFRILRLKIIVLSCSTHATRWTCYIYIQCISSYNRNPNLISHQQTSHALDHWFPHLIIYNRKYITKQLGQWLACRCFLLWHSPANSDLWHTLCPVNEAALYTSAKKKSTGIKRRKAGLHCLVPPCINSTHNIVRGRFLLSFHLFCRQTASFLCPGSCIYVCVHMCRSVCGCVCAPLPFPSICQGVYWSLPPP